MNATHLHFQLLHISKGDKSIFEYLQHAESLANSLAAINAFVTNDNLTISVLRGLGSDYSMLVTAIINFLPLPVFSDLRDRLLSLQSHLLKRCHLPWQPLPSHLHMRLHPPLLFLPFLHLLCLFLSRMLPLPQSIFILCIPRPKMVSSNLESMLILPLNIPCCRPLPLWSPLLMLSLPVILKRSDLQNGDKPWMKSSMLFLSNSLGLLSLLDLMPTQWDVNGSSK